MEKTHDNKQRKTRITIVVLTLVFFVPFVSVLIPSVRDWIGDNIAPSRTKSYGELVNPPRPLDQVNFVAYQSDIDSLEKIKSKWSMFYLVRDKCDQVCNENLIKMREARYAQSGNALRISYYLIFTDKIDSEFISQHMQEHPRLMVLMLADKSKSNEFINQFKIEETVDVIESHRVYLVDPIGNLMMSYPMGFHRDGLLKDLKKILHYSQIG